MTLVKFRRQLAADLGGDFRLGKKSLSLAIDTSVLLTIFPESQTMLGVKSVGIAVAIYRESDRSVWLREYDAPPGEEWAGTNEVGEFGLLFGADDLLDRPHDHRWSINDPEQLKASSRHVAGLIASNLERLRNLCQVLPNKKGIPAGRRILNIPEQAWLAIDEWCPWAPCLQQGRRVTAGGVWPEDGTPNYAV